MKKCLKKVICLMLCFTFVFSTASVAASAKGYDEAVSEWADSTMTLLDSIESLIESIKELIEIIYNFFEALGVLGDGNIVSPKPNPEPSAPDEEVSVRIGISNNNL